MEIGEKIQLLRKSRGISLSELSKLSGVALATLSRMEHHKMTGTLDSHLNIAKALGINLTELYSEITAETNAIEKTAAQQNEKEIFLHSEKATVEILTNQIFSKKMMPVLIKLEASGKTAVEQAGMQTEKFAFVLDGKVDLYINKIKYSLNKGESLYFDGALPHYFENTGKAQNKVLCVSTPPSL